MHQEPTAHRQTITDALHALLCDADSTMVGQGEKLRPLESREAHS